MILTRWRLAIAALAAAAVPSMAGAADLPAQSPPPPTAPAAYAPAVPDRIVTVGVEPRVFRLGRGRATASLDLAFFRFLAFAKQERRRLLRRARQLWIPVIDLGQFVSGRLLRSFYQRNGLLYRTERIGGRRLRVTSRRLRGILADAMAAPSHRGPPRLWRRDRRYR